MDDQKIPGARPGPPSALMHLLGDGRLVAFDAAESWPSSNSRHAGMCHSGGVAGGFVTGWLDSAWRMPR
jgi:hypothetical protein